MSNKPITYEEKMKDRDTEFLYDKCVKQYHSIMNYQSQMCEYKSRIKELETKLNKLKEDTPKEPIVTLRGTPNLELQLKGDLPQYKDWWQQEQENKAIKEDKKIEDTARFQYSQIPSWFDIKEVIGVVNENFERHQQALNKIIDKINGE